jgi:hypothetical protein
MNAIGINDAFHRLVKDGMTAERAWKKFTTALMSGELRLWCNGNPVALDYLNAQVRFIIRNGDFVAWPAGGGIGWAPHAYTFTIDGAAFDQLPGRAPRGRPRKVTAERIENEKALRGPISKKSLAGYLGVDPRTLRQRKKRTK